MASRQGGTLKRADANTIQDKVLVGYQGWFTCAGDGAPLDPGHHGWLHWFNSPIPSGGRPNVDLWPDTSDYDPSELYPAPGLTTASGDPVYLFSSRNPKTVRRHFHWMALHGVDGAFLQRFAGQCEIKPGNLAIRDLRDEIGDRVREAAEEEGRVFAIMYDVSGVSPDKIHNILEQDWVHLLRDKHILDSPNYLHEKGRPVVALWGFGFNGRNHSPELVRAIAAFFRSSTHGGVYLVAGAPGHWRTSTSDADRNPEFIKVWTECFDAISPWTVGRYGNEEEADQWGQGRLKADADYLNSLASEGGRRVDYIPVVLPGGSGFNLSEGKWRMNDMRRNGGRFLWTQLYNARRAGVRTIYGAMWDEYDEGTVFMPIVSYASQLPVHPSFRFLALDVDGQDLPSDWYMRVLGYAAEAFHGERTLLGTFPVKELQDYWSARPKYQVITGGGSWHRRGDGKDNQADVEGVTRAFRAWEVSKGTGDVDAFNDAPPPYSIEDTSALQGVPQQPLTRARLAGGPSHAPPVRQDTRPSTSHARSLAAATAGAAAVGVVAHALSGRSASTSSSTLSPTATPPPVNISSRPVPPTKMPSYGSSHKGMMPTSGPAPSTTHAGYSSLGGRTSSYTHTQTQAHAHAHTHERGSSFTPGGVAFPAPPGPPPSMGVGIEYAWERERGRGRSRSRSKSKSRSKSRSRSRSKSKSKSKSKSSSRSSSRSRKGGRPPVHSIHQTLHGHGHGHGHGHSHNHSHSSSPGYVHGPGHNSPSPGPRPGTNVHRHPSYAGVSPHGHGPGHHSPPPVGSPPGMAFPGAGVGVYDTYSGGGGAPAGGYAPIPMQVGYGGHTGPVSGYTQGQQGYGQGQPPYTQGSAQGHAPHGAYAAPHPNPNQPPGGYGYSHGHGSGYGQGQGQGYDAMTSSSPPPPQQYGYTPPCSGYYPSYGPNPGPGPSTGGPYPSGSGSGRSGGIQGGITTALQAVEGIAGPQTRRQLEKTVKSLTNTGSSLLNKLK